MNYLDANFITATFFPVPGHAALAEKFFARNCLPILVSELAELECRRAFMVHARRANGDEWLSFQARLDSGEWQREPVAWTRDAARTRELVDRHGATLAAGILDTMHVAKALLCHCTTFVSFDTNSNARVLAASARLKVWPELSAAERGRVAR